MGEKYNGFREFPEEDPAYYDEDGIHDIIRQIHDTNESELLRQETAYAKLNEVLAKKGLLKKPFANK